MGSWTVQPDTHVTALRRWQSGLARAFVRLDAEAVGSRDLFGGRIDQVRAGRLRVSRVAADAHRVIRRREHVAQASRDVVFVNLQIAGRGGITLGNTTWDAAPMDISVVPTGEPYAIQHGSAFELISIALPAETLPESFAPGRLALSAHAAGRELAGMIASLARVARTLPDDGKALEAQFLGALQLVAAVNAHRAHEDHTTLRAAVKAHIARRHGDPSLSAAPIAAAFGLGERQLHALFAGTGRSVGERIEAARMETARGLLEDTDLPVSTVAARSGFRDPAYFARVFRRAHGMSPRDWRAAQSS
ncbi:helix-turn-helix domain-containing protein [Pontivivens ytuae]|uniref:AraC family transcriptional regulator n=1 Tax=Pontivivens ytuae TaxID=2789856 RepID=A0A7S9LR10_9RHOB|nr:AraC family transcriptional regulator [Pontivivens ytuae]QPH53687.1 AraC family transcriptional regulator [Pontivivens ytuae]